MSSDPFDKINQALAIEGAELMTLQQLRASYPQRGNPYILFEGTREIAEIQPGHWREIYADPVTGLPPGCPVQPLGMDGDVAWFLNPNGQVVALKASSSGKGPIDFLFCGLLEYLEWAWPRYSQGKDGRSGEVNGYQADQARCDLVYAASAMGVYDDTDRLRGRGAWLDDAGRLIYHAGNTVLYKSRWHGPGALGRWVFPAGTRIEPPWPLNVSPEGDGPADELLELLKTWKWRRPELDPLLLLGFNCMAMIGGALRWRSMVFLTGERGTGKSTLLEIQEAVHGGALRRMANVSQAYLYQKVKFDCTPVALDELEAAAEGDMRKVNEIIKLMRVASSGGSIGRGSSEGAARDYYCRSAFMCGAINIPPMAPQDQSRFAILALMPFPEGTQEPEFDMKRLAVIGRQLLTRMLTGFDRWSATFAAYHKGLVAAGHDGRAADQFGALIAAQHIARSDAAPSEADMAFWAEKLAPSMLAETANRSEDWRDCLNFLLDVIPDVMKNRGGKIHSVGGLLRQLREHPSTDLTDIENVLPNLGLALTWRKGVPKDWEHAELFIPANHPETRKLFAGTNWQGLAGAAGVWFTTLQRAGEGLVRVDVCGKGLDKKRHGVFMRLAAVFPKGDDDAREAA